MALPTFARDFEYEYEGQTVTYTVVSEEDKTCVTKAARIYEANNVLYADNKPFSGNLIIPSVAKDGVDEYSVIGVSDYSFFGTKLETISFPESVTSIGEGAFMYCGDLTSLTIPESVTSIGVFAFAYCTGLTSLTIPKSVTSLEPYAFCYCFGLTSVYYGAKQLIKSEGSIFSGETYDSATLYVTKESVSVAETLDPWQYFKKVEAYDFSGIEDVIADLDEIAPYEIFNLQGRRVEKATRGHIYII
ncbi:MAG: leucine-rich repeat domain-containing protein, partial [Muribaculaceae bacterium]|nr:leucine-rich repeat domain-containing protein [Muribaculaceae bacterium]